MKIEKGKKYRCISNYPSFKAGVIYPCYEDEILIDEEGDRRCVYFRFINNYFELVEEPSTEDLLKRIEALERKVKQQESKAIIKEAFDDVRKSCETVAKFKRIADHAQAITNEITTPKEEVIYVPDGILSKYGSIRNGKYVLFGDEVGWRAAAFKSGIESKPNQFKLVPVKREDLKAGDVAFRTDCEIPNFNDLGMYCVILEDGYQHWGGKNCFFGHAPWDYWYKVVKA